MHAGIVDLVGLFAHLPKGLSNVSRAARCQGRWQVISILAVPLGCIWQGGLLGVCPGAGGWYSALAGAGAVDSHPA